MGPLTVPTVPSSPADKGEPAQGFAPAHRERSTASDVNLAWTLDLGCGRAVSAVGVGQRACGLDIDFQALHDVDWHERPSLVCGRGEQLPFRDCCFGSIVSRVAVPYMRVDETFREMERVLLPGGTVQLSLHPLGMTVRELRRAVRARNLKNTLYRCFIIVNGTCFHLTGRQVSLPFRQQRCEFFQTRTGIARALRARGFCDVKWQRGPREFIVNARKAC